MKFEIKNWAEFQQYKDDRPMHWIKLHNSLLEDYNFNKLPELTQLHLLKLWLLASKQGGKLEGDDVWLAKLLNTKKLNINLLVRDGFLIRTDSYEIVPREEKSREDKIRVDESREDNLVTLKPDGSLQVFKFWQETFNHPRSAFDDTRKVLIKKQLKHYSVDDLKKAIHGCSVTPHNMGDNNQGAIYDSIKLILRDAEQIDRFMNISDNPPTGKNIITIEQTKRAAKAQSTRIMESMGWTDE